MSLASLELDLDVFSGPFDLLLTLVLREEVDLLERGQAHLPVLRRRVLAVIRARYRAPPTGPGRGGPTPIRSRTSESVPAAIDRARSAPSCRIASRPASSSRSSV